MKKIVSLAFKAIKGLKNLCDPACEGHPYLPKIDMEIRSSFTISKKMLAKF